MQSHTFSAGHGPRKRDVTLGFYLTSKLGNWLNGFMKTTIELPNPLVKQVKLRALHDGRKFKDTVADLLRKGLAKESSSKATQARPSITTDKKTGLPLIRCNRKASPTEALTPDRIAEILLDQEVEWYRASGR